MAVMANCRVQKFWQLRRRVVAASSLLYPNARYPRFPVRIGFNNRLAAGSSCREIGSTSVRRKY